MNNHVTHLIGVIPHLRGSSVYTSLYDFALSRWYLLGLQPVSCAAVSTLPEKDKFLYKHHVETELDYPYQYLLAVAT